MTLQFSSLLLLLLSGLAVSILPTGRRIRFNTLGSWPSAVEALIAGSLFTLAGSLVNDRVDWIAALAGKAAKSLEQFSPESDKNHIVAALPTGMVLSVIASVAIEFASLVKAGGWRILLSRSRRQRSRQLVVSWYVGPMHQLLSEAMLADEPVMLTLNWNKVYIGYVLALPSDANAQSAAGALRLLPILSGYRDKDVREVHITDNYSALLLDADEAQLKHMEAALEVCIRYGDVIAATWWDEQIFGRFSASKKASDTAATTASQAAASDSAGIR